MGYVYQTKGRTVWMMKYYRNGVPIRESSGTEDKTAAKKICKSRETDIDRGVPVTGKVGRLLFEEAAADVITDYTINALRSLNVLERRIQKHLTPYFRKRRMSTLTQADVRDFIAYRKEQGIVAVRGPHKGKRIGDVSNAEINRELTTLKRMFSLAVENGKLLYQPHIPMLRERNVRTGFFERDQFLAVCQHLPADLAAVLRFAYVTGWRIDSEVLPLQWRQVDFQARISPEQTIPGTITLDPFTTKNGEGRVFPFTEELKAVLTARRAERDELKKAGTIVASVFFRMVAKGRGGPKAPRPITAFTKAWRTACRAAGAPGRIPHDLRRTAVRNLVRAGVPERVAMRLTGHKTRSVFDRYNIVSDSDLGLAAARIDQAVPAVVEDVNGAAVGAKNRDARRDARSQRIQAVSGGSERRNP